MQPLKAILSPPLSLQGFVTVKHPLQIKGRKCAKTWHYKPGSFFRDSSAPVAPVCRSVPVWHQVPSESLA